jgi:conjugal transfer pilus assembly protein TraF
MIFSLSILISSSPIFLNAGFYDRAMEGRYWYDERFNEEPEDSKENKNINEENALESLEELKQKFETIKALAVLQPNRENLLKYMTIQNELVINAEKFANVWQQILLENPMLNGELTNPTAQYGIQARKAAHYMEIEALLNSAREKHVLLFVYDSSNKLSQAAGEMVQNFVADTNWQIVPITVDGKDLPEFPNSKILADQGLALGLKDTPAYIVGNLDNETIQHVGFGAISVSRLKENIYTQLKAQDHAL